MAAKKQAKKAQKHPKKQKHAMHQQQLDIFSAFSHLWQTPVR